MSTTRQILSGVLALCFSLGGAHAAPAPPARQLFEEGKALYQRGSHLEALLRFDRAAALEPRASTHLMMARCYRRLHRPDTALHHYERHLVLWALERKDASPYQDEVALQIKGLKELVEEVRRAEAALEARRFRDALSLFRGLPDAGWPRVQRGLALCNEGLGDPERARALLAGARKELRSWRDAWQGKPPDQDRVRAELDELEALESRLRAVKRETSLPAPPAPATLPGLRPDPPTDTEGPAPRRRLWLGLGIGATALAVGAEIAAWIGYGKATGYYEHEPEYGRYRAVTVAGHVIAGVMAGAAAASFVLYHRSGRRVPRVAVFPLDGGGALSAALEF